MTRDAFDEPVRILRGLGVPQTVETAFQAYVLLSEWPQTRSIQSHGAALKACRAAMNGLVHPDAARKAFVAFAQRTGILASAHQELALPRHGITTEGLGLAA